MLLSIAWRYSDEPRQDLWSVFGRFNSEMLVHYIRGGSRPRGFVGAGWISRAQQPTGGVMRRWVSLWWTYGGAKMLMELGKNKDVAPPFQLYIFLAFVFSWYKVSWLNSVLWEKNCWKSWLIQSRPAGLLACCFRIRMHAWCSA